MTPLEHMIRRARRRTFLDRAIRLAGLGLLSGCLAGLLLLAIDRLAALGLEPGLFALPAGAGLIVGVLVAMRRIPNPMTAAVNIDREMRLKDQFGSAESLLLATQAGMGPRHDPEFAALVRRDADQLAGRIDVRTATPIRVTPVWGGSLAAAALLWLGVLFVPSLPADAGSSVAANDPAQRAQIRQQRQDLAQSIDESVEQLKSGESAIDERTQEELAALSRLADQLSADDADNVDVDQLRDESAARLNEIADRLAEDAQRDLAAREQVARKFAGLKTPDPPPPAEEFTKALERGDFTDAADALDNLTNAARTLSDDERQAVAEHLRDLGRDLGSTGEADRVQTDERAGQIEQALRDQGLDDETIDSLLDEQRPLDEVRKALEDHNVDPEVAQDLARDIERLQKQREFDKQVGQDTDRLTDALDRAAQQVEQPEQPEPPQGEQPPSPAAEQPDAKHDASGDQKPEDRQNADSQKEQPQDEKQPGQAPEQMKPAQGQQPPANQDQPSQQQAAGSPPQQPPSQQQTPPPAGVDQPPSQQPQEQQGQPGQQQQQQQSQQTKPGEQPGQQQQAQPKQGDGQQQQVQQQKPGDVQPGQQQQPGGTPQPAVDPNKPGTQPVPKPQPGAQPGADQPKQVTDQKDAGDGKQAADQEQAQGVQEKPGGERQSGPDQPASDEKIRRDGANQPGDEQQPQSRQAQQQQDKQAQPEGAQSRQQQKPDQRDQTGVEGGEPPLDPEQLEKAMKMLEKMPSSVLRELAKRAQDAQKNQEISEQMREQARRMIEQMSDEQRRRWMDILQRQNPRDSDQFDGATGDENDRNQPAGSSPMGENRDGAPDRTAATGANGGISFDRTEDIDLRGNVDPDEVVAEWLSDEQRQGAPGKTTTPGRAKRIENAQHVAERAVDESVVPPRYHEFIKRYFGNLNRTVDRAAGEKPAAPEGESADKAKPEASPDAGAKPEPKTNGETKPPSKPGQD